MKPSEPRVVLLDAGPLIHLDELGPLALLTDFDGLLIPADVLGEALRHRRALTLAELPNGTVLVDPPRPSA